MRCHICDALLSEPVFNSDLDDWEPCGTCLAVINDAIGSHEDRPAVSEDEFGDDRVPIPAWGEDDADVYHEDS